MVGPVAARVDLEAKAARLAEVEVGLLSHAVAARAELDVHLRLHQHVRGSEDVLDGVDPERKVVEAPGTPEKSADEPEVVRLLVRRHHREDDQVGVVVEPRVLREAIAERVAIPLAVAERIASHDGDVVELARCDAVGRVALGRAGNSDRLSGGAG